MDTMSRTQIRFAGTEDVWSWIALSSNWDGEGSCIVLVLVLNIYELIYNHIQIGQMRKLARQYLSKLFPVPLPEKVAMQEIHKEISASLTKAYQQPEMKQFISSLPVQELLNKSVEYFVGSRSTPRNQLIMKILMEEAQAKAEREDSEKLRNLVRYYYAYYIKMGAMKDGNEQEYDRSSDMFMELAQKGDPLSNYLVGKQIYKMVETGKLSSWKDDKVQNQALEVFTNSLCSHQYGGMYYVADVFERYREDRDISEDSERMLFELYSQAASLGYALAYFKVALLYRRKGNYKMYKNYLVLASEAGVVEAQHNLGLEYAKGQHFPKDEIKALAWFIHASAHGFIFSKYNVSRILAQGSSCGRLKPNPKASLVYLEEISRSGQLDVTNEIRELVAEMEKNQPH